MSSCFSISGLTCRLGEICQLEEVDELKPYTAELQIFRDLGFTKTSIINSDLAVEIEECILTALDRSQLSAQNIDRVIFCGEPPNHGNSRIFVQNILQNTGLAEKSRFLISGNSSGDAFAGLEIAGTMVADPGKSCLVVSYYRQNDDHGRLSHDNTAIKCDGVVALVVKSPREGQLHVRNFCRVDHTELSRLPVREDAIVAAASIIRPLEKLLGADAFGGQTSLSTSVSRKNNLFLPSQLTAQQYSGKYRDLNLLMAGQPLFQITDMLENGILSRGQPVLLYAPSPHSTFAGIVEVI
ncbi:hypothetical protein RMR21_025650 (plasmid) [Agrobacterium sp. rho-8.1]|nr:hypothetical protein [Agrobacterium sp. rho-8.1]